MEFGMNEKCLADILMFSRECDVNVCKKYIEAVSRLEEKNKETGRIEGIEYFDLMALFIGS